MQIKHLFKIYGSTALGYRFMFIRFFRFNRCFEKGFVFKYWKICLLCKSNYMHWILRIYKFNFVTLILVKKKKQVHNYGTNIKLIFYLTISIETLCYFIFHKIIFYSLLEMNVNFELSILITLRRKPKKSEFRYHRTWQKLQKFILA